VSDGYPRRGLRRWKVKRKVQPRLPWWVFVSMGFFGALVATGMWWGVLKVLDVRYGH